MKKFEKRFLKEVCCFNEKETKLTMDAQKLFPELLTESNDKDFIIDGRKMHEQLKIGTKYADWIKDRIKKYRLVENTDFITSSEKSETANNGYIKTKEYIFTLNCAKKIAMRQNNELGDLICDYFILMEKALKIIQEHIAIREPEKENYNIMKETIIKDYESKQDKVTDFDRKYLMIRECRMLDEKLLGLYASEIKSKLGYLDNITREHLEVEKNKALNFLQEIITGLVIAGVDFEQRSIIIENICKNKYPHLRMDDNKNLNDIKELVNV